MMLTGTITWSDGTLRCGQCMDEEHIERVDTWLTLRERRALERTGQSLPCLWLRNGCGGEATPPGPLGTNLNETPQRFRHQRVRNCQKKSIGPACQW